MRWLSVVALGVLGCSADVEKKPDSGGATAAPPSDPVRCDGSFSTEPGIDVERAQVAADGWNAFVGRPFVRLAAGAPCRLRLGPLIGGDFAAQANGVITVDPARAPKDPVWMRHLLMHEMGHAFGLSHLVGSERGVMAATRATATPDFTDADRVECVRVHVCE